MTIVLEAVMRYGYLASSDRRGIKEQERANK